MRHAILFASMLVAFSGRADPPSDVGTVLQLGISDDDQFRARCTGIAPRRVEVFLDGKRAVRVAIACTTELRAPAERVYLEVRVPAGKHRLRVVDVRTRREATLVETFPKLLPLGEGSVVADHLDVDVGSSGVTLGALGAVAKRM